MAKKKDMRVSVDVNAFNQALREFAAELGKLERTTSEIERRMVYAAANIVADAVREEIENLPYRSRDGEPGVKGFERAALLAGLGISPMQVFSDDFLNASIGFDGVYEVSDTFYKPIPLIARSINSGTSFSPKIPFVRNAVRRVRKQTYQAMQKVFEEEVNRIMSEK